MIEKKYKKACMECGHIENRINTKKYKCQNCKNFKRDAGMSYIRNWNAIKKELIKENDCCEICRRSSKQAVLHVHHKDKNRRNNDMNNLQILCNQCHTSLHQNVGRKLIDINYGLYGVRLLWE